MRAGTEIKVTTERPSVNLSMNEMDKGSWVILQLPGFTTAASGTPQSSLEALRQARALVVPSIGHPVRLAFFATRP